jgi:hypothetical protein
MFHPESLWLHPQESNLSSNTNLTKNRKIVAIQQDVHSMHGYRINLALLPLSMINSPVFPKHGTQTMPEALFEFPSVNITAR